MKLVDFQLQNAEEALVRAGYQQWDNGWIKEDRWGRFHAQLYGKMVKKTCKSPRHYSTRVSLHYDTLINGYHTVKDSSGKLLAERRHLLSTKL